MARRIAVELVLNAAPYIYSAMRVKETTEGVEREMDSLDRAVDKVDRDMAELAVTSALAGREVDKLGGRSRDSAAALRALDERIKATRQSVRDLGLQFAETGDQVDGRNLSKERSLLGRLERLRKELEKPLEPKRGGLLGFVLPSYATPISAPGTGSIPLTPLAIGGAVAAAAAALPMIGAMVAGAVTGTVGLGGIAGGIFAASKDDRVRAAATSFVHDISEEFFGSGSTFVAPVIKSLDILKQGFQQLNLGDAFRIIAPDVTVVAQGIAGLARNFMPGFTKALTDAKPVLVILGQELPKIGRELGYMLQNIANSKGVLEGFKALMGLIEAALRGTGNVLHWLSDKFHDLNEMMYNFTGTLAEIARIGHLPGAGELQNLHEQIGQFVEESKAANLIAPQVVDSLGDINKAAASTADAIGALNQAYEDQYRIQHDLISGNVGYEQSLANLTNTLNQTGASLDDTTQAGRDNITQLLAGIDAAKLIKDEMKAAGVNTQTANDIFQQHINELVKLEVSYGLNEKAVRNFISALVAVPPVTRAQLFLEFNASGTLPGEHSGPRIDELAGGVISDVVAAMIPPPPPPPLGQVVARAGGGLVVPGGSYTVGEYAPEALQMGWNGVGMVTPMAQPWGGSGGGSGGDRTITIIVKDTSGRTLRQELITDALNRNQSQSVVSAAYP